MKSKKNISEKEIFASGDTSELQKVRVFVEQHAREFGFSESEIGKIILAVDEACSNIIRHSYKHDPTKNFIVRITSQGNHFQVDIFDSGESFDPMIIASPDMKEYFRAHKSGGLGIHIMRMVMDEINYIPAAQNGSMNRLSLMKNLH